MKRVVITGMGIISPIGNSVSAFWENLIKGECGIGFISRFDTTDFKVKVAAEVKDFVATDYMDRNEERRTDLFCRYGIASAYQAMQDSGLVSGENIQPQQLGVYMGSGVGGISTFMTEAEKMSTKGPGRISPLFIPMMIPNMVSGHVAMKYAAKGPSLPAVTACATSSNTIGEAFRAIKHGYATAIIAGGSEASIIPIAVAGFTNCMALTSRNDPQTACVPFDKRRDGFVMAEGGAALVLEEYQHALSRGANIYGEICGYGNTCDAYHITAPHPEAESSSRAIMLAADEAGIDKENHKIYVNAHGTSTQLNDKTETLAIKRALGETAAYRAKVSSTKSMTGHMLGAAGAAEAIVSILALKEGVIPPTIGYSQKDEDCDLDYTPNTAANFAADAAISVSLGFGGHNAVLAFKKFKQD